MTITPTLPTIALLTDFGSRDGYTGVLKGVILNRAPGVSIVDISHDVPPQDVWAGSWVLGNSYRYFPANTIFVAVVDPGVGSADQNTMLIHWPEKKYFFIGPDNGLMTAVIKEAGGQLKAYEIANAEHWLTLSPSATFHGRDIYSPTAGSLTVAIAENRLDAFLDTIGPAIDKPVTLDWQAPRKEENTLHGQAMYVDIYGNVITSIPNGWLPEGGDIQIECSGHEQTARIASCYKEGDNGGLMALCGSSGTVEIARNGHSAAKTLACRAGSPLCLTV